jgi:exopolyphosphatase / guanosine-5'-triphosphate,3'-diphosphate pyrophosphatase
MHFIEHDEITTPMMRQDIKAIMKKLINSDKEAMIDMIRLIPERVHTILPGLMILKTISKALNVESIFVENFGVREGYLYQQIFLSDSTDIHNHEHTTS